ncbi:hypothetical protein AKJ09_10080 [Labilithrix luteola]|uniref:Uncharacterized protein n=1 Tax=Labilithrix luteola TaxID=1391654 RepID=A0A0K1QCN0_9BACT|nr:hypothetical protein [Labilithrix luteola]AKV03417.1 hypothetical protein AKJ09_10080 [Labilithrix luteola]
MSSRQPFLSIVSPVSPAPRLGLATVLVGAVVVACGGAPEATAPSSYGRPETTEPATIAEAQDQIAHAAEELRAPGAAQPSAPPADHTGVSSDSAIREPSAAPRAEAKSESACASQCRALASMRRAVTALCRMTGADDARCKDATRTLTTSEQRVSACSC